MYYIYIQNDIYVNLENRPTATQGTVGCEVFTAIASTQNLCVLHNSSHGAEIVNASSILGRPSCFYKAKGERIYYG